MADVRRKYDDNPEDIETFVSVKNLRKEFGEKVGVINNSDDETYMSVRERLRRIDTRQDSGYNSDNNDNVMERSKEIQQIKTPVSFNRDYIGSFATPGKLSPALTGSLASSPIFAPPLSTANLTTPRTKFGHLKSPNTRTIFSNSPVTNVSDRKSFPPPTVQSHTEVEDSHHSSTSFSHHSSTSLKENSGVKEVFQYGNVMLKKVEKPIEDKWKKNLTIESSSIQDDTGSIGEGGSGPLCQSSGFSLGRGDNTNERTKRRSPRSLSRTDRSTPKRKSNQNKANTSTSPQVSPDSKTFSFASSSSANSKKPQSLKNRCVSVPNFVVPVEDQLSPSVREERYQNDLAAALKKVGLPLEDKWKYKKNSDEENSDSSKPLYATVKLRSVGTPTHPTAPAATPTATGSKVNEELQHSDDQRSPNSLKQKFDFHEDDKKPTLVKRQRVPSTAGGINERTTEGISVSNLAKSFLELHHLDDQRTPNSLKQKSDFHEDDKKSTLVKRQRVPSTASDIDERTTEGISVSNLAKSFSSKIKLASKGERAEEEKVTGRVSSEGNEITRIRNSLKSTAQELEDVRKSLSSTPVSKMIAERNKTAKANRFQGKEVLNRTKLRRCKSMSSTTAKHHRSTQSASSILSGKWPLTHSGNPTINGHSSVGISHSPLCKCSHDGDLMSTESKNVLKVDCADDLSQKLERSWESFKGNDIAESGGIWDIDLDDPHFFEDNVSCPAFDEYYDDDISGHNKDEVFQLHSLTSDGSTSDSEGDFYYRNYGQSRYIQITLSSGGITEKFEPAIVMSPTDESFVSFPEGFQFPMEHQTDMTQDPMLDPKPDKRKPLKGAKKFFFGKNKKKNGLVEV